MHTTAGAQPVRLQRASKEAALVFLKVPSPHFTVRMAVAPLVSLRGSAQVGARRACRSGATVSQPVAARQCGLIVSPRKALRKPHRFQGTVLRAAKTSQPAPTQMEFVPPYTDAKDGRNAVLRFYHAFNNRDLDAMMAEFADDVFYEDLVYDDAFVGAKVLRRYFEKCLDIPDDLRFVLEDITDEGGPGCGVMWHVELTNGTVMPFSRGASFYKVNDEGRICKARDLVEALPKAGDAAFGVMKAVTPLIRMLGERGITLKSQALAGSAIGMWAFYASYMSVIMLGDTVPGEPALHTSAAAVAEVLHESLNFFYVNIFLNNIGITLVPSIPEHPVSEALFNFVNAWSMMMLPLFLLDRKSENMPNKMPLWFGTMFLTNVFCIPYMAYREQQIPLAPEIPTRKLPRWAPAMGAVAIAVGLGSMAWAVIGRGEYGDLPARLDYLHDKFYGDRVFFAFVVDSCLYCVWQAWLMDSAGAPKKFRFVPFFGLAAWLIGGEKEASADATVSDRRA